MGYGDGPFVWIGHTLLTLVTGFFSLVGLLVAVAVVLLLVRFLLVATKAAQLYIAKNTAETDDPAADEPTAPAPVVAPVAPKTPRTRAPKTPPQA